VLRSQLRPATVPGKQLPRAWLQRRPIAHTLGMKVQTRYAKTADGVSIGYSVTGTGVPLLFSFPIGHQILMAENPVLRPWFEGLARRYQLVVFEEPPKT